MTSDSGKMKVFAGRRSDPFFFNLGGTRPRFMRPKTSAPAATVQAAPPLHVRAARPGRRRLSRIAPQQGAALRTALKATPAGTVSPALRAAPPTSDCFESLNVMAIVVQVDKTQLNQGSNMTLVGVGRAPTRDP